ncbi:hypothetical protein HanRHA438_Chr16g0775391 [Helianthus annuus]|nr:hypothetical protein HanRHA438_Chr16g0775391 [Helianthus annuus]
MMFLFKNHMYVIEVLEYQAVWWHEENSTLKSNTTSTTNISFL